MLNPTKKIMAKYKTLLVKTRWISMLSHAKRFMAKYKTIFVKMALDSPTNQQAMLIYEHFCDLHILL
jgi:hypothetical protein